MAAVPATERHYSDEEDAEALIDGTSEVKENDVKEKNNAEKSNDPLCSDEEDIEALFGDAIDEGEQEEDSKAAFPVDGDKLARKGGEADADQKLIAAGTPARKARKILKSQTPKGVVNKEDIPLEMNVCQQCGIRIAKGRNQAQNTLFLVQHSMAHLDVRPYQCSICDFVAARHKLITLHRKRQHEGEGSHIDHRTPVYYAKLKLMVMTNFPLQMNETERHVSNQLSQFSDSLSIHMDVEREVEKNQCQLCGKKITLQKDPCINTICIMQHSMIHIDHKPFSCPQCGITSRAKDEVRKHQIRVHGEAEEVVDGRSEVYFKDLLDMSKANFPLQIEELERSRNNDALKEFYKEFGLEDVSPIKSPPASTSRARATPSVSPEESFPHKESNPMDLLLADLHESAKKADSANKPSRSGQSAADTSAASIEAINRLKRMLEDTEDGHQAPGDEQQEHVDDLMALFGHRPASNDTAE
ncbi:unnamed protein product, partial [Mesorhabditis spiculigera]